MKEFILLYEAVTGKAEDEDINTVVESMVQLSGRERDQFPAYLLTLARSLAARQILLPAPIPEADRYYGWLLRELLPLLPGCDFKDDETKRELFICTPLGMAAVINQSDETYAVIPWPEEAKAEDVKPRILGSFDPTAEEIRQWAYDPDLLMYAQDEEAILSHRNNIPLFLELASDPNCPKRKLIIAIADDYVANARGGPYDRELMTETILVAAASTQEDLKQWSRDLQFLLDYLNSHGPVDMETASTLARLIIAGRFRPAIEIREETLGQWWQFSAWDLYLTQKVIDFLYICRDSGALIWSHNLLTKEKLNPYALPEQRDQYLSIRLG